MKDHDPKGDGDYPPVPPIDELVARVDAKELRKTVEAISFPRHFVAQREANERAGIWIADQFHGCELPVHLVGPMRNVVALPQSLRQPIALVCSHFDTVPETPGADDNGSAIAAMLECARVLSPYGLPVGYVCFNREEDGLLGSLDFVRNWLPKNGVQVAGVHVLEMVGFASNAPNSQQTPPELPFDLPPVGNFLGLLGDHRSSALLGAAVVAAGKVVPELPVIPFEIPEGLPDIPPVFLRSDHAPFWEAGIPALMWTDTSEFRNSNYHQATDTPETLDYEFLAKVTRALVGAVMGAK
jgi:hypothetical protein